MDCCIFPLDTLRARLQAPCGFQRAGGFRSLYKGIHVALIGSAPGSALFFCTFEAMQVPLSVAPCGASEVTTSAVAAMGGELAASCVRAPTELFKQRLQTNTKVVNSSLLLGWRATIVRDLPFSTIQYPLYNLVKRLLGDRQDKPMEPWKAAICGSMTSALAATITTPLDLVQTRLMLEEPKKGANTILGMLQHIYKKDGCAGLFKGAVPRTVWMGLGGFIFLGSYEQAKCLFEGEHQNMCDNMCEGEHRKKGKEAGMSKVTASRLAASDVSAAAATLPSVAVSMEFHRGDDEGPRHRSKSATSLSTSSTGNWFQY